MEYNEFQQALNAIMADLSPIPKDIEGPDFNNGRAFYQHDIDTVRKVRLAVLNQIKLFINHPWVQQTIDNEKIHPSYVYCLLDGDKEIALLSRAWLRISCIDRTGREWGQPHYATEADK